MSGDSVHVAGILWEKVSLVCMALLYFYFLSFSLVLFSIWYFLLWKYLAGVLCSYPFPPSFFFLLSFKKFILTTNPFWIEVQPINNVEAVSGEHMKLFRIFYNLFSQSLFMLSSSFLNLKWLWFFWLLTKQRLFSLFLSLHS